MTEQKICDCECECHRDRPDGCAVIHFIDCCEFCYEKYINEDGTIDHDRLYAIKFRKAMIERRKITEYIPKGKN